MTKNIILASLFAVSTLGSGLALSASASAGEGHWSIGHGVQCKVVNGTVVCSKTRP